MIRHISSKAPLQSALTLRNFSISAVRRKTYKVQDVDDFDKQVVASKVPVIVDFYARWCNPCRTLTPRLESIMTEREGKVDLAKVDIDENTDLALKYNVGSVPTLMIMKNGKEQQRIVGLQDADKLKKWIDQATES